MKTRFAFAALLVALVVCLSAPAANAGGLFGGLLSHVTGCCEASCGCEPSCAAPEPTCAAPEPTCGCEPSCGCEIACGCGLLSKIQDLLSCLPSICDCAVCCDAEPSCGCEPTCGCEPSCGL
jgi:hypothetical protein